MRVEIPNKVVDIAVSRFVRTFGVSRIINAMSDADDGDVGPRIQKINHAVEVESSGETPIVFQMQDVGCLLLVVQRRLS